MNFDFTAEETQFAERVRRFAREHLAKDALKRAHAPGFPFDVAALMAKQGLMGISLPESEGGQGGSLMDAVIAAVNAGCLPALPTPSGPPTLANAHQCLVDEVQLRQATLGVIAAGIATPPDLTAALQAATALATALTAINSDTCLPVSLPVPTVPPVPPPAPTGA